MKISHLALIPLCLAVSSCSVMDVLGPRPNKEIVQLAQQAEADAASLADAPDTAQLRSFHAEQLHDEISRLCGTDDAGAPPPSCRVSDDASNVLGAGDKLTLAHNAPAAGASAARSVPKESVPLVVAQAIDTAATQPVEFPEIQVSDSADLDAARAMLREEFALDYALGLASAFADDGVDQRIEALREASSKRRGYLTELLEPSGDVPVSAPGYELGDLTPTDPASAATLVDKLSADSVARWRAAAADAASEEWMTAAIALAAQAQRV